jgi:hypothetical protein
VPGGQILGRAIGFGGRWPRQAKGVVVRRASITVPGILLLVLLAAWTGQAEASRRSPTITVRGVQQIGRDTLQGPAGSEDDTTVEPAIAMDPNNANHIVATYQEGRFQDGGSAAIGYATSQDGGKTWVFGDLPGLTVSVGGPYDRTSDPSVAFGPDGEVYAGALVLSNGASCPSGASVSRSDDGGVTWNDPVFADHPNCPTMDDKTWLTVDTYPSSPHFGRVYFAWDTSIGGLTDVVRWSDDKGATWSPAVTFADSAHGGFPVSVLVQPNGNVTFQWSDLRARTSTDGGQTYGSYVTISSFQGHDPSGIRTGAGFGLGQAAVDRVTGKLYVVWQDARFRTDGMNDIVMSSSSNGTTWTAPMRVNQDATSSGIDHFDESVAAYNGVVHVAYVIRSGSTSQILRQQYTVSMDGGATFSGEKTLGPRLNLQWAAEVFFSGTRFLGDYFSMTAGPGVAHPVWVRPSRPSRQQTYHQTTWSATIKIP